LLVESCSSKAGYGLRGGGILTIGNARQRPEMIEIMLEVEILVFVGVFAKDRDCFRSPSWGRIHRSFFRSNRSIQQSQSPATDPIGATEKKEATQSPEPSPNHGERLCPGDRAPHAWDGARPARVGEIRSPGAFALQVASLPGPIELSKKKGIG
jgi:hypothetical protein